MKKYWAEVKDYVGHVSLNNEKYEINFLDVA